MRPLTGNEWALLIADLVIWAVALVRIVRALA